MNSLPSPRLASAHRFPGAQLRSHGLARPRAGSLGLDRYTQLRDDYFGNYRQVLWFAQDRTPTLQAAAERVPDALRLRLAVRDVGVLGLEPELRALVISEPTI